MFRRAVGWILLLGVASACATPGQVRGVDTRITEMEKANARADSIRAVALVNLRLAVEHLTDAFLANAATTTANVDSLKQQNRNVAFALLDVNKQLYVIESMGKATAADLASARAAIAEMENLQQRAPGIRDTSGNGSAATPGDATLIALGVRNTVLGAFSEARSNLRAVIDSYPTSPRVPTAYLDLGKTFLNPAQPDSERYYFTKVYDLFPKSDEAPQAAHKLAELADNAVPPDKKEARKWYQIIFDQYKNAPEWATADAWLKRNP